MFVYQKLNSIASSCLPLEKRAFKNFIINQGDFTHSKSHKQDLYVSRINSRFFLKFPLTKL